MKRRMLSGLALVVVGLVLPMIAVRSDAQEVAAAKISGQRRVNFDRNWRFYKDDAPGAEIPTFDDSQWKPIRLPHDWAIEGPFDPKLNPDTGGLPVSGIGWYRKSFLLPESARGHIFTIMFDGAMSNSTVWLNGQELGGRPYGYSSFFSTSLPTCTLALSRMCSRSA